MHQIGIRYLLIFLMNSPATRPSLIHTVYSEYCSDLRSVKRRRASASCARGGNVPDKGGAYLSSAPHGLRETNQRAAVGGTTIDRKMFYAGVGCCSSTASPRITMTRVWAEVQCSCTRGVYKTRSTWAELDVDQATARRYRYHVGVCEGAWDNRSDDELQTRSWILPLIWCSGPTQRNEGEKLARTLAKGRLSQRKRVNITF